MANNKNICRPDDVEEGQEIFIPYYYCKKSICYIEAESYLLRKIEVYNWDDKLYEMYEYDDLKINTNITEADFNGNNKDDNFN